MATYDSLAEQYKKTKNVGVECRQYLEEYTYFKMLGNIEGKTILDLACGEGHYTRKFKEMGASKVVGVDISEKMVELARLEETREPLGIEYIICDASKLGIIGSFDLVVASYLLVYSKTKQDLLQMCQSIFANLKPGGHFVTIQTDCDVPPEFYPLLGKYQACIRSVSQPLEEGVPIDLTFSSPDGDNFIIQVYYHSKSTYEWAFQTVGFKEIRWEQSSVSPEGLEKFGQEFWQDAIDYPPMICIECVK